MAIWEDVAVSCNVHILAEQPQSNGDQMRPLETVAPLVEELVSQLSLAGT